MEHEQIDKKYFQRRMGAMEIERSSFIPHYKETSAFVQPRKGNFSKQDRNNGKKKYTEIINSAASDAHKIARSGLLAGMMSPSRPWFKVQTADTDLMEFQPVKVWLEIVERTINAVFNESNLYNMAPGMIGELLTFGTGYMSHVDDFEDVARFYTHTAGSYMIAQDERFVPNTAAREVEWTVHQLVRDFGIENVSPSVRAAYDRSDYDTLYPMVHFVEPNPHMDKRSKLSVAKKFRSVYFEPGKDNNQFLSFKGFDEFPGYIARWDVTGEDIYGTDCPAMTALGDIKMLQVEEKRKAQAIDKIVNPPLHGPGSLRNVPVSGLPGATTIYDANGSAELKPVYQINPNLGELRLDIEAVEGRINSAFMVDMFLAISRIEGIQPRNELDIASRNEERLLMLGPVLEQIQGEWADKMINRTFNQCLKAGILPPAPEELSGAPLRIKYISTLAMAQRAVSTQSIERYAAFGQSLVAGGWDGALDKFDADQAMDEYGRDIGVSPSIIVPDDVVQANRQARAQEAEKRQALETLQSLSGSANQAAGALDTVTGGQ